MSDRIGRERQRDAMAAIDLAEGRDEAGAEAMLLATIDGGSYPGVAAAVYTCQPLALVGDETEGAVPGVAPDDGTILAVNIGSTIPPVGARVIAHAVGGRWCFRWDS